MSNPLFAVVTGTGYAVAVTPDTVTATTPTDTAAVSIAVAQALADTMPAMWIAGEGKQLAAIENFCEALVALP